MKHGVEARNYTRRSIRNDCPLQNLHYVYTQMCLHKAEAFCRCFADLNSSLWKHRNPTHFVKQKVMSRGTCPVYISYVVLAS